LKKYLLVGALFLVSGLAFSQATVNPDPPSHVNSCGGLNNGSISFTVTGGVAPFSLLYFGLSFGQSGVVPITLNVPVTVPNLQPDTYLLAISDGDASNPNYNTFVTITNIPAVTASLGSKVNNPSCSTPNGQINITVGGGTGTYNYAWTSDNGFSPFPNSGTLSGLTGGNYTVIVSDPGSNCTASVGPINITDPSPAVQTVSTSSPEKLCTGDAATISLVTSQVLSLPKSYYEILDNGNPTGIKVSGTGGPLTLTLPSGSFADGDVLTVLAVDDKCTPILMSGSVTIKLNTPPTSATLSGTATICATHSTNLSVTIVGGTPPYSFSIGNYGPVSGYLSGSPLSVTPAATTVYTLSGLVVDANGCSVTGTGTATVTVNPIPTAVVNASPGALCAGQGSSTLTFTLTGAGPFNVGYTDGTNPFNLVGVPNGQTVVVSPVATTTYTITSIQDATTCFGVAGSNTTVTVSTPPTSAALSLNGASPICAGQSTTIKVVIAGGVGPYDFTITGLGLQTGYVSGTPITVMPAVTTSYTLAGNTVTDSKGCTVSGTGSVSVTVNPLPTATISASPGTICAGSGSSVLTFTMTGTPPFDVQYLTGVGTASFSTGSFTHTVTVSPASTTNYSISSIDDATTCSGVPGSTATVTVNTPPTSAVLSLSGASPICAGQNTTLKVDITGGTGPFDFNITGLGAVTGYTSGTPIVVTPGTTTLYSLSGAVTDVTTTCTVTGTGNANVVVHPLPSASMAASPSTICSGSGSTLTLTLIGTGPFDVVYSDGSTNTTLNGIANGDLVPVSPVTTTVYTIVSVSDATGCTGTGTGTTVTVNTPASSAVLGSDAAICQGTPADLVVTITGGATPFTVTYSDGSSNFNVPGYSSGASIPVSPASTKTYSLVSVIDANNCPAQGLSGTATITVHVAATPVITGPTSACVGATGNVYTTSSSSGESNYTWTVSAGGSVSGGGTTADPTITIDWVGAGAQSVGVSYTDGNGCVTAVTTYNVTIGNLGATPAVTDDTKCTAPFNGAISLTVTGAVGVPTFSWTGPGGFTSSSQNITNLAPGMYSLTMNDPVSGCGFTSNISVNDLSPTLVITQTGEVDNSRCVIPYNGSLDISVTGSLGAPTFQWTGPGGFTSTSQNISSVVDGSYDVTVTDPVSGCSTTLTGLVVNNDVPVLDLTSFTELDNTQCSAPYNGSITLTPAGGGPTYTYAWTGPAGFTATTATISALQSGTYNVTVTDVTSGCTATTGIVVSDNLPTITGSMGGTSTICSGQPATLSFILNGQGTTFNVVYTDGTSNFPLNGISSGATVPVSPVANTSYSLVSVVDVASTCSALPGNLSGSADITVNPSPTPTISGPTPICEGATNQVYTTEAGKTNYAWTISGGTLTSGGSATDNTATVSWPTAGPQSISVNYTDVNGCPAPAATVYNVNVTSAPTAVLSGNSSICVGSTASLTITLTGVAPWSVMYSDGSTSFPIASIAASPYTLNVNPLITTNYSLLSVSDASCGAGTVSGVSTVTVNPIPGNPATYGVETWLGYVYDDSGDPTPLPARINFSNTKYRGVIDQTDIAAMSPFSSYNTTTQAFDLNISDNASGFTINSPNVCGTYNDTFSIRFRMKKTFTQGIYTFTVGTDDGARLMLDGVNIIPGAFIDQPYTTYTSAPQCVSAGVHTLVLAYYEDTGFSRISFNYQAAPGPTVTTPATACVNSATPTLTASSSDPSVTGFNWYKDAGLTTLLFSGANFTPAAADLDMTTAGTTSFFVTSVYACGETIATQQDVTILNSAVITPPASPQVCQTGGIIDLSTLVSAVPSGGSFTFSGTGVTTSPSFDPTLVSGSTTITANYTSGSCSTSTTFSLSIVTAAAITVPASPVSACQADSPIDMTTLVSATPTGGTFTFSGPGVTGNNFDPSAQSGAVAISVGYNAGGCTDNQTLNFNVVSAATLAINNSSVCPAGGIIDLTTFVTPSPTGGTLTFSGPNVVGNFFDPSSHAGSTVNISIGYVAGGCSASGTLSLTVLNASSPACTGGGGGTNCGVYNVTITDSRPSCSNQNNGTINFSITGGTPNYVVNLTDGGSFNQSIPGPGPSFSFVNLSPANYQYTITDNAGNTCTLPYSLPIQTTVQASASAFVDALCFNQPVGGATLTVSSGGSAPFAYSVDNGANWISFTSPVIVNNLLPGSYSILVGDDPSDPCPASVAISINNAVADILAPYTVTNATCANNDGSILIGTISGGTAPYTYLFDGNSYATLPAGNLFTALSGGTHTFLVIDANNCQKDFPIQVTFPGLVNFTTVVVNPDCTGNGSDGGLVVTITSTGSFQVGVSTDPVAPPSSYQSVVSAGSSSVTFNNLGKGTYYVNALTVGAQCPTVQPSTISAGPDAVDFQFTVNNTVCFADQGGVTLTSITGSSLVNYAYQISSSGNVIQNGVITPLQAISSVVLTGLAQGSYQIQLSQDQSAASGCTSPITSAFKPFNITGPSAALDTLFVTRQISLPDLPTGSMTVGIAESGQEPYEISLELTQPLFTGQNYSLGWTVVTRNPNDLKIEYTAKSLYAGEYKLSIRDSLGCERDYVIDLPVDKNIFIPNIFTPNGDGFNDVFYIRNLPAETSVVITNRWGKEVFHSGNYQNDWGGTDDGVYYYRISASGQVYTGWLEIQRGQ
jgi:large repetitive protein